jgi:hypothetical protein
MDRNFSPMSGDFSSRYGTTPRTGPLVSPLSTTPVLSAEHFNNVYVRFVESLCQLRLFKEHFA